MALSKEVQAQADEIRRNKSLVKSLQAERDLWKNKANDMQAKIEELAGKVDKNEMSAEDRAELERQAQELDALNDELEGAAQENTKPEPIAGGDGSDSVPVPDRVEPEPIPDDPAAERPDPLAGTARGDGAPLMPNMAFDPDPVGIATGNPGQPGQPQAIETAGGFVVTGGGTTARAPGSSPESPSSSQVVPLDPDAKAPTSTADLVKSGLGDSSQNALIGNDGQPVSSGSGVQDHPTADEAESAQKQQDMLNAEMEARRENPLNLAPEGTPQAGTPEAEKAAHDAAIEAQCKAQDEAKASADFPEEAKNPS